MTASTTALPDADTVRGRALERVDVARAGGASREAALMAAGAVTAWALCAEAERDRARATVVHLEQQLAAVAVLAARWRRYAEPPNNPGQFGRTLGMAADQLREAIGADQ